MKPKTFSALSMLIALILLMTLALTLLVFRSSSLWIFYENEIRQEKPPGARRRGLLGGLRASQQASGAEGIAGGGH